MVRLEVHQLVDLSAEKAWESMSDFSNVQHIHPLVRDVDQLTENGNGLGAARRCHFYDDGTLEEEIIEWDEQAKYYRIKVLNGNLPLNNMIMTVRVEDVNPKQSRLFATVEFDPKHAFVGQLLGRYILKPKLGEVLGNMLAGVQYYEKEGTDVPEGWKAPHKAVVV
mmetsp:Transcript_41138/g.162469  ORF Transcript_41138/g.162469 Transcript_41138/m.162469 type:complete len:166 (-) Transcript_41138:150-647(-)